MFEFVFVLFFFSPQRRADGASPAARLTRLSNQVRRSACQSAASALSVVAHPARLVTVKVACLHETQVLFTNSLAAPQIADVSLLFGVYTRYFLRP